MEASATYPGSIGEIIQGRYKDKDILLSCPVNLYTKVKIYEKKSMKKNMGFTKSELFMRNIVSQWGFEPYLENLNIKIDSDIPKGKGFASSTADLCATYLALVKLFSKPFNENELVINCLKIEPTDSIVFDKYTIFDYKNGEYKETLGQYAKLGVLVFEGTRVIDTIEFNRNTKYDLARVDDLVELVKLGVKGKKLINIGEASTESILRNRDRLRYDVIDQVLKLQKSLGGLGVIGAHSGDMLGIIFDDEERLAMANNEVNDIKGYKKYAVRTVNISRRD